MHRRHEKCIASLKGRDHSEDPGVDGKIILEWILREECGKFWIGCIWLSTGIRGGFL
jgi:hypothetical protein